MTTNTNGSGTALLDASSEASPSHLPQPAGATPNEDQDLQDQDTGNASDSSDTQGGSPAGESREGGQGPGQGDRVDPGTGNSREDEIAELQAQIAQRDELLAEIAERMERDPSLRKSLSRQPSDAVSTGDDESLVSFVEKALSEGEGDERLNPRAVSILTKALRPVLQKIEAVERMQGESLRALSGTTRTIADVQFGRSLADRGVSPEIQRSRPFQKHLRALEADRRWAGLRKRDPGFAAEIAADRWAVSAVTRSARQDDRARLDAARQAGGGSVRSQGTAGSAVRELRLPSTESGILQAYVARQKDPNVKITYFHPKD
jgi:hypothetical protein